MNYLQLTSFLIVLEVCMSTETNLYRTAWLSKLPGKTILKPVIRNLYLVAIKNFLLKQTVLITDGAAMTWKTQRCNRVNKAGCQTTETTIAKACIWLLWLEVSQFKAQLRHILEHSLQRVLQIEINEVCVKQTAQQELNREVVNLLLIILSIGLISLNPVLRGILLYNLCQGLINLLMSQIGEITTVLNMCGLNKAGLSSSLVDSMSLSNNI